MSGMIAKKVLKKSGSGTLKLGALAAVGGLAWKAYQQYSQRQSKEQAVSGRQPYATANISEAKLSDITGNGASPGSQLLILRGMIAAAYADGHIDAEEQNRIFQQVDEFNLGREDKAELFDELRQPQTIEQLVQQVPNAEIGLDLYTASVMAIDLRQPAALEHLRQLAMRLQIPAELCQVIHKEALAAQSQ